MCRAGKKNEMSELQNWLKEQKGVEHINALGYRLWYNEKWCYAQITITPYTEEVAIKPMQIIDDIGKGKGVPVYMSFKRDLDKEIGTMLESEIPKRSKDLISNIVNYGNHIVHEPTGISGRTLEECHRKVEEYYKLNTG